MSATRRHYTAGELVEIANIISRADDYSSVEACAREVIPAVRRLLADRKAGPEPDEHAWDAVVEVLMLYLSGDPRDGDYYRLHRDRVDAVARDLVAELTGDRRFLPQPPTRGGIK